MTTLDGWTIRTEALRKIYRLYRRPGYRFLDLLGVCPAGDRFYTEHLALDQIDITICHGEKVAIIGRNGAGKSTLLKLMSGIARPTSGVVEVRGSIKALLEIGTGFHPEFTGRENVLSALAYQGIVGVEARQKLEEVVDFAELEEYIDQPIKTYSLGMKTRLMFAAATCVEPDVLIADEVLGVGDAYFAQKSFERVKRLVQARGTTFLLVTHGIYSALEVCDRFIWLDRGRVMLDGPGMSVIGAYEQSIKEQEERRQHRASVRAAASSLPTRVGEGVTLRFKARNTYRPDGTFYLARLTAVWKNGRRLDCAFQSATEGAAFRILAAGSVEPSTHLHRPCVTLREYGDIFHKLDCWLSLAKASEPPNMVEVEYALLGSGPLVLATSTPGSEFVDSAELEATGAGEWRSIVVPISPVQGIGAASVSRPRTFGRYGTADVTMEDVRVLDDAGEESLLFRHGRPMRIEIDYLVRNPVGVGEIVATVGMHRDGYLPIAAFFSLPFSPGAARGAVVLAIDNLRLTNGEYVLGVGLIRPNMPRTGTFFSMSPDVFDHRPRAVTFGVIGDDQVCRGWAYVQESKWTTRSHDR